MKVIYPTLLIFCLLRINSYAQQPIAEIERSEFYKYRKAYFHDYLYADDKYFYTFGSKRKHGFSRFGKTGNFYFRKYRQDDFTQVDEKYFEDWEYKDVELEYDRVLHLRGNDWLLFKVKDDSQAAFYLVACTMKPDGTPSPMKQLARISTDKPEYVSIMSAMSADSSKMGMLFYGGYEDEAITPLSLVFDQNMEVVYRKDKLPTIKDEVMFVQDMQVTNEGNMLLYGYGGSRKNEDKYRRALSRGMISDKNRVPPSALGHHMLFRMRERGRIQSFEISDPDHYIHSATIREVGDILLFIGLTSNQPQRFANGILIQRLDPYNLNVESSNYYHLENHIGPTDSEAGHIAVDVAKTLLSLGSPQIKDLELMKFKDIITTPSGAIYVILEQDYIAMDDVNGFAYSNEALVLRLDAKGNLEWMSLLPKRQYATVLNDMYTPVNSYFLHQSGENLHLLFIDDPKNIERRESGEKIEYYGLSGLSNVIATVNSDGTIDYQHFFQYEEHKDMLMNKEFIRIGPDEYLITLIRKLPGNFRFGRLKFNDDEEELSGSTN